MQHSPHHGCLVIPQLDPSQLRKFDRIVEHLHQVFIENLHLPPIPVHSLAIVRQMVENTGRGLFPGAVGLVRRGLLAAGFPGAVCHD